MDSGMILRLTVLDSVRNQTIVMFVQAVLGRSRMSSTPASATSLRSPTPQSSTPAFWQSCRGSLWAQRIASRLSSPC